MQRNLERDQKIANLWNTGRYKSYSALARVMRTYPKAVQRAVQRLCDQSTWVNTAEPVK